MNEHRHEREHKPEKEPVDLNAKLVKDLETARHQYKEVIGQLDIIRASEQALIKKQIALEALIEYISSTLG